VLRFVRVLTRYAVIRLLTRPARRWRLIGRLVPATRQPGPRRLRLLLEDLGGSFVKFGQILALQSDVLPLEYCDALFDLLDRVEPVPFADLEPIFVEELGRRPAEVFDSFDTEPLATASVGQVHVAYRDGRKVAVKIQRPTAQAEFRSDIRLMGAVTRVIRRLHLRPLYWLLEPIGEFVRWTSEELDYRSEATYSEFLRLVSKDNPVQVVPAVHRDLTTPRVLVVEYLEGVTLLEYFRALQEGDDLLLKRLEALRFDRARFAANVIDNFVGDAFRHGVYHADLHPANLMILEDSVVGYIDFGITGVMSPHAREHLLRMTLALVQGDRDELLENYLQVTVHGRRSDREGFRGGLERLSPHWYGGEVEGAALATNFTHIMGDMLRLSREFDIMPERDVIKYIRSSIAVDGLVTRFVPGFDLGRQLAETCGGYFDALARRARFSPSRMLEMWTASTQLMSDGASRGARFVERLLSGELAVRFSEDERREEEKRQRSQAQRLSGAAFGGALLVASSPTAAEFGLNVAAWKLAR
jgi:ubiquinone biosynthesis protein